MFVSHFPRFSVLSPKSRSYILYFSYLTFFTVSRYIPRPNRLVFFLHVFQCFSPYFMYYHVSFSFSSFVSFLAKFQVLECVCNIFHVFQFSHHNPGPTMCVSFYTFISFLSILQVLPCFSHFPLLSVFSKYSRSYSVCFSFSTFFRFFTIFLVLQCAFLTLLSFSVLLDIFQVIQCFSIIFHVFSVFLPQSRSYSVYFSYLSFFTVSCHISCPNM